MDERYSRPTPAELTYELKDLSLNQRSAAVTPYLRSRIYWQTRFVAFTSVNRDPVMQASFGQCGAQRLDPDDQPIITALVDKRMFPELGDLRQGRIVDLHGTLLRVDAGWHIVLSLDRIEVQPEKTFFAKIFG